MRYNSLRYKNLYLFIGISVFLSLSAGGCIQPPDMGDDWDWENGDGKTVKVRVALNTERLSLPTDTPSKEDMRYLEAIFREQGTGRYYTGSAEIGESRIMVSVPSGTTYDILVLAGTPADGNVTTGLRCSWQAAWFRHIRLSTARTP